MTAQLQGLNLGQGPDLSLVLATMMVIMPARTTEQIHIQTRTRLTIMTREVEDVETAKTGVDVTNTFLTEPVGVPQETVTTERFNIRQGLLSEDTELIDYLNVVYKLNQF